jgi:hypothetical protein
MLRGVTNSLPFAKLLGIEITEATPEKVTAEMMVRDELCTLPVLHGGAITWLGDKAGALGIHDPRDDVPSAEGGYLAAIRRLLVKPFEHRHVWIGDLVVAVDARIGESRERFVIPGIGKVQAIGDVCV